MTAVDGRRERGARSRRAIMRLAVNIASVQGLDGLSIGGIASDASISKSGVVALFGTKEQLQLATIETAREIFVDEVIRPTLAVAGGRDRLDALIHNWLEYSRTRVFEGGCFFAAAIIEVGSKPGQVRDSVASAVDDWYEFVTRTVARAQQKGDLAASLDAGQLAFEITAFLDAANARSLITGSAQPYEAAATAARRALG